MAPVSSIGERRTSVDEVFDYLHEKITSLELKPGDRISEAEIASRFGISRQPVRDAFSRLANNDLLLIRPQRATEVRGFSMREIEKARFVRAAVEKEVLLRAATHCSDADAKKIDKEIEKQTKAVASKDHDAFGQLDYDFHKLLCAVAQADYAFDVISEEKAKVDRLCALGFTKEKRMTVLMEDHRLIAEAIKSHDTQSAVAMGMTHLARLDETIERIRTTNANFFDAADD